MKHLGRDKAEQVGREGEGLAGIAHQRGVYPGARCLDHRKKQRRENDAKEHAGRGDHANPAPGQLPLDQPNQQRQAGEEQTIHDIIPIAQSDQDEEEAGFEAVKE